MSYVKFAAEDYNKKAEDWNMVDISRAITALKELSFNNVSSELAAGATGVTTNDLVFVMPTKGKLTSVKFIKTSVNTGADNTPVVSLRNLTTNEEIGTTAAIALGGAVGDVHSLTLNTAKVELPAGTVLQLRIVNPTATITTALKGKSQIEWHSVV